MNPTDWLDYGMGVIALGTLAYVIIENNRRRQTQATGPVPTIDLAAVVQENTKAVTRLTVLIENQGQMLQRLMEILDDLRFDRGRSA